MIIQLEIYYHVKFNNIDWLIDWVLANNKTFDDECDAVAVCLTCGEEGIGLEWPDKWLSAVFTFRPDPGLFRNDLFIQISQIQRTLLPQHNSSNL